MSHPDTSVQDLFESVSWEINAFLKATWVQRVQPGTGKVHLIKWCVCMRV